MSDQIEKRILAEISRTLDEEYGIHYGERELDSLALKVGRRLKARGIPHVGRYLRILRTDPEEVRHFLDEVTVNKTEFFRERGHWEFIEAELFPEWARRMRRGETIKIWSAACATGAEPYSVAMLLDALCAARGIPRRFRVLATDVSRQALEVAALGTYRDDIADHIKKCGRAAFLDLYFDRRGTDLRVKKGVREFVTFRSFNLKSEKAPFKEVFDLVMCCNVLIYFRTNTIGRVVTLLERALRPGGHLFIGHTENLLGVKHGLVRIKPAIFRKG